MRCRSLGVLIVAVAVSGGACGTERAASVSAPPQAHESVSTIDPARQAVHEHVRAQIAKATTDICTLVTPEAVAASFGSAAISRTAPMTEGHGPACGYPHPDHGGYLLVIQFRTLASWDTAATAGTAIDGLGVSARLDRHSGRYATLFVRDQARDAVVTFLAPEGPPEAVIRVASLIYHR